VRLKGNPNPDPRKVKNGVEISLSPVSEVMPNECADHQADMTLWVWGEPVAGESEAIDEVRTNASEVVVDSEHAEAGGRATGAEIARARQILIEARSDIYDTPPAEMCIALCLRYARDDAWIKTELDAYQESHAALVEMILKSGRARKPVSAARAWELQTAR
jgi:hypothetical protein